MKVTFTSRAKADLREIALFIARDSLKRARSFVADLRAKAKEIGENPDAFPVVDRFEKRGVRRRVVGNYLIFYRGTADSVIVLRILHGPRELEKLLQPFA